MSTKFYSLTIQDIKPETDDTVSIAFSVPVNLSQDFKFKPGQYLTLKTLVDGSEVRRSYSICSAPSENELRVAVKRINKGTFSSFATQALKIGDTIEVMPPMGNFSVQASADSTKNHVFIAAGSGITPVISMIKSILETEKNSTVYLYYSNKTKADTIFKKELDQLAASNPNFKLNYILTREDSGNALTNGRLDRAKFEALFNAHLAALSIDGIYACGPQEMILTGKDLFISKGIPSSKIHFELFTATPTESDKKGEPAGVAVEAAMTVIMDDEPYSFKLNTAGKSILQAAQDAGADVPFSCKGGVCCTCKAKVLEGTVKMDLNYALDADEVAAGFILTCQSHPTSEKVVVSFDEY
ncbi:MAG: 2Fe-2S iron-sulfur cluster binding domain-containing protein [Bacteroidetes bacterium]|nr:2Fe-2S iron-sulfur cluster binding domain-containing protein [Bacteroidota bacterium]